MWKPDVHLATVILLFVASLAGCASGSTQPTRMTAVTPAVTPSLASPTPLITDTALLGDVPTACIGLGLEDCQRVVEHVATLGGAGTPRIDYIQVGPFGCLEGERCATTLASRPEGYVLLESANATVSFHIKATPAGPLEAERQEAFMTPYPPASKGPIPGAPQAYSLGHCGLLTGIDIGGSWWDPIGPVDAGHPDSINPAQGVIAFQGPDRAVFTSNGGLIVQLHRRDGAKHLPGCD
jgi:hypothetical protein